MSDHTRAIDGVRSPSASMVVAVVALFVALSGAAYAAVAIPDNSVGSAQLKSGSVRFSKLANGAVGTKKLANNAVTFSKIAKGQIGHARVSQNQIQWRVTGACTGNTAVQSVAKTGSVTCAPTLPTDYSTPGLSKSLTPTPSTPAVLASEVVGQTGQALLVTANPYIQVGGSAGTQNVVVTCTLAAVQESSEGGPIYTSGTGTGFETQKISFALESSHEQAAGSVPLSVTVPPLEKGNTADSEPTYVIGVSCVTANDGTTPPIVQASSSLNALAVGAIDSSVTPGTSFGSFGIATPAATTPTGTSAK